MLRAIGAITVVMVLLMVLVSMASNPVPAQVVASTVEVTDAVDAVAAVEKLDVQFETKVKTSTSTSGAFTDISYITTVTVNRPAKCTFELEWQDKDGFAVSSKHIAIGRQFPTGVTKITGTDMARGTGQIVTVNTKSRCK